MSTFMFVQINELQHSVVVACTELLGINVCFNKVVLDFIGFGFLTFNKKA